MTANSRKNKKIIAAAAIFIFLALGAAGFYFFREKAANISNTVVPGQLKITKVGLDKYSFKTLDNNLIEIGSEKNGQPSLKLNKWDGEVSMKIDFPDVSGVKPKFDGQKLTYSNNSNSQTGWLGKFLSLANVLASDKEQSKVDVVFYPKQKEQIIEKDSSGNPNTFIVNEQGGVEFDTIIYSKPEINIISYPIETNNLDFYYQPALNEEERESGVVCTETACQNEQGQIISYRPENVVGSYAAYYADGKSGDYSAAGGQNYKTGKAFHIYRPKVTDAAGKETWGELDIGAGNLTVTVPQDFLDSATYPVKVDPNFGYDTIGQSTGYQDTNDLIKAEIAVAPSSGTVSAINAYLFDLYGSDRHYRGGIYDTSGNVLSGGSSDVTIPASVTSTWYSSSVSTSITVGTTYWLAAFLENMADGKTANYFYDTGSGTNSEYSNNLGTSQYPTFPNPWTPQANSSVRYSVYAVYATAGGQKPTIASVSLNTSDSKICKMVDSAVSCNSGPGIVFNSVASDPDAGDSIKLYICRDNICSNCGPASTNDCWAYSDSASVNNPSAVFDYLNAPSCGGDAKWANWEIDVDSSHVYHFQDRYISDIDTLLLAVYRDGNGNYTYEELAYLPPAAGWTTSQVDVYPPAGTFTLNVVHLITEVGSLTTDNSELTQDEDNMNLLPNPGFETDSDSDGVPDYWHSDYWGRLNQVVFSYPVSGDGGGRAAKVQVVSLKLGSSTCRYCVNCDYWAKVCDSNNNCSSVIGE